MVQNTKTIPTIEEDTPTPKAETKTISISVQITYEQILDLALQLGKAEKEALMEALGESLEKEEVKQEDEPTSIEEPTPKYNSTTIEEIKSGKSDYQPVGKEYLKKLQEEAKKVWEDEPLTDAELNKQIEKHL